MSGYFGKKPGFRIQPLTLSQIRAANDAAVSTISGLKTFSTTPKFSALTQGSIPFIGAGGQVSQDNAKLFWDDTNDRLGIGTTAPSARIEAHDANNSQFLCGTAADQASIYADTNQAIIAWGLRIIAGIGTARQTAVAQYRLVNDSHRWYFNTGLTIGNPVTATEIMRANGTGLGVLVTPGVAGDFGGVVRAKSYTLATLPAAASNTRGLAWVSDMTGGAQYAYSDGTNWRKVADLALAA